MLKYIVILGVLLVPVGVLVFGARGCDGFFPQESVFVETEDSQYLRGKELLANGRDSEAMSVFQALIREHPDSSAESNFDAGLIAFNQGNFPLAIYHFNQFLSLRPDAPRSRLDQAIGLINSSKKGFLSEMLPGRQAEPISERISPALEEKYRAVMSENEALKREIARLRERLARPAEPPAAAGTVRPAESVPALPAEPAAAPARVEQTPPPPPPVPEVPATHTVSPGDTLSSISKKYYGTSARWPKIYEANRVTMSSPSDLKPGMVLKLPRP